jgi:hypothetical protein
MILGSTVRAYFPSVSRRRAQSKPRLRTERHSPANYIYVSVTSPIWMPSGRVQRLKTVRNPGALQMAEHGEKRARI